MSQAPETWYAQNSLMGLFTTNGRTDRLQYLYNVIFVSIALLLVCSQVGYLEYYNNDKVDNIIQITMPLSMPYILIALYFMFMTYVRRLHDLNKSGLWILLIFIPGINIILKLILFFMPGSDSENDYGSIPEKATIVQYRKIVYFMLGYLAIIFIVFLFLLRLN